MAIPAEVGRPDTEPVRRPGDFARHPGTGAPWVAHPTEHTKGGWPGTRADLIALCAARGIAVPDKATKTDLQRLLGPKPRWVMYGRPSNFGKYIELTTSIARNSERRLALGAWLDPAVLASLDQLDRVSIEDLDARDETVRHALDGVAAAALRAGGAGLAADRGTWFHAVSEHVDRGESWAHLVVEGEALGIPGPAQLALVDAYHRWVADHAEMLAIEQTCVDDLWQLAGTLDRVGRLTRDLRFVLPTGEIATLPAGWVGIIDLKTGALRTGLDGFIDYWASYAPQVVSYQQSLPYDVETDQRGEWQWELDPRWAVILHVDVRSAIVDGIARVQPVLVDLEAGRDAGTLCVAARQWGKRRDVFSIPTDDLTVTVPVPSTLSPGVEAAAPAPPAVEQQAAAEAPNTSAVADSPGPRVAISAEGRDAPAEAHGTSAGVQPDDDEQRTELLARFKALTKTQQAAFRARNVPIGDYDAIAAALDEIEAPPRVIELAQRRMADDAERDAASDVPARPDEGAPVSDADFAPLETAWTALGDDARAWFRRLVTEAAAAGVDFRAQQTKTVRRYEIYRGLVALTGWLDADDDGADEVLQTLVWSAAGADDAVRFANVTPGHALGSLGAAEAAAFAHLAHRLAAGTVNVVAEPTGRLALVAI